MLVVNKPPGWIVEPLPGRRAGRGDAARPGRGLTCAPASSLRPAYVVHRIDRDTSGLVLFALSAAARDHLKAQFERQSPERVYLAVVNGHPEPDSGTWRDKLVWDKERLIQKRAHLAGGRRKGRGGALPRARAVRLAVADRGRAADGEAEPDPRAGRGARLPAGRRTAVPVRPVARRRRASRRFHARRCTPRRLGFVHPATGRRVRSRRRCRRTWRN